MMRKQLRLNRGLLFGSEYYVFNAFLDRYKVSVVTFFYFSNTNQIWDRKYAKIDQGVLQILNDKHDGQPFYTLPLMMSSNIIKIVDVAESNDSTFDKDTNEDYEQMLKIEVYNLDTGWLMLFLYIIVSSVSEKLKWVNTVKTFLENSECTVQPQQNHDYKDIIYTFEKDKYINVNCVQQISQSVSFKYLCEIIIELFV